MNIFSYVVARDFGFAPNPFFSYCTLATCKPKIRTAALPGDLVIGTCPSPKYDELSYFMFINEKVTFSEYWNDARFKKKRPNLYSSTKFAFGDNIYSLDESGKWQQADSHHTYHDGTVCQQNVNTDTTSEYVLISTDFAYFGSSSIIIPEHLHELIKRGPGHKRHFSEALKLDTNRWIRSLPRGILSRPRDW